MTHTPAERFAKWFATREDRLRACAYGSKPGETSEPKCTVQITLRGSTEKGHRGFCSSRHDALAQEDAPM